MRLNSEKNSLISQVHQAFRDVKPPTIDSGVKISYLSDIERMDLAAFLDGKDWSHVTSETIAGSYRHQPSAILFFLTEEGFHYYFPAFLLISLNLDGTNFDDHLLESAFVPFAKLYSDDDNKFYRDRVRRFTMQQLQVTEAVFQCIWGERRKEIIYQGEDFDSKLIRMEMEDLEGALRGVRQEILERELQRSL